MTQFYFHRSNTKKRRRADSTELNERCLTTTDPVTSFYPLPARDFEVGVDQME
jgi:hypothetical protein